MITLDLDQLQKLKALPVNQTITFQVDDRNFSIIDTEFLNDLLKLARVDCHSLENFRG